MTNTTSVRGTSPETDLRAELDAGTRAGCATLKQLAPRTRGHARTLGAVALLVLIGAAERAAASEGVHAEEPGEVLTAAEPMTRQRFAQGPFAFVVDPSTPAPGTLALAYTVGMGSGISADRPIPVVLQAAGVSNQFTIGYGVASWLTPVAAVTATSSNGSTVTSAMAGIKFELTRPRAPLRVAFEAGALREGTSGASGTWLRVATSWTEGPLLVGANGYAEHVFATGRDSLDYAVMGGASWRLLDSLRAGVEYVGQDLEEMAAGGAEGGARQAAGPTVAFDVDRGRYQIVAAALFGVGAQSPAVLVRVGLLASF